MKEHLSIVKFLTSVKVKEESNYCRDNEFDITKEGDLIVVTDRKSGHTSYVPIHNVSYYKLKAVADDSTSTVSAAPTKKKA